jgi:hypothetical protein
MAARSRSLSNTPTIRLKLPKPHAAQKAINQGLRRFAVINAGRRFGKDIYTMNKVIEGALAGWPVAWGAPSYKMLSENWKTFKHLLAPIISKPHEQEKQLELITGGVLDMWSLDAPDRIRGRKYKRFVLNEAAMVPDLLDVWNMIIRPTLMDLEGDALFPSTPKGLNGFFTLWQMADSDPNWARFHYTTYDNPYIPKSEIDDLQRTLPERVFRQEILAEFIEDGSFFQNIDAAAVVVDRDTPDNHQGHHLVMGIDFALSQDWTVITVGCRDCTRVVDWQRFQQLDFTYQRERIIDMAKRWGVRGVLPERNSIGEPNIEILMQRGLPVMRGPDEGFGFNTTATSKPALIQGLAAGLEHDGFKVPKDYADELRSYEVEMSVSGHPKFSAPEGQHDDRVISLALCWYAMTNTSWYFSWTDD